MSTSMTYCIILYLLHTNGLFVHACMPKLQLLHILLYINMNNFDSPHIFLDTDTNPRGYGIGMWPHQFMASLVLVQQA